MMRERRKTQHDFESAEHVSSQDARLILGEPRGVETGQGMRVTRVRTRHAHSLSLSRTRLLASHTRSATCVHTYVRCVCCAYDERIFERLRCRDTRAERCVLYVFSTACHTPCTDTELAIGDDCRTPSKLPGNQQQRQDARSRNFMR